MFFSRLILFISNFFLLSFSLFSWSYLELSEEKKAYLEEISQGAKALYVLDVNSKSILYEKNSSLLFNPASMTKIVVLDIAYDYIKDYNIPLDTLILISSSADYRNSPPHSSLMFLQQGQMVTLGEVLKGIAIPSGNDATVALAEFISGSEEAFIEKMNEHVKSLGFSHMHFVDTSGYSPENFVTVEEMSLFTYQYIHKHPEVLKELHSLRFFTFPEDIHGGDKNLPFYIRQENKNYLLRDYEGADGVKTGFIDEVGYNLMATALRDNRRIIVGVIGIEGDTPEQASSKRTSLSANLLDYAFDTYQEVLLPEEVGEVPLLGSLNSTAPLKIEGSRVLLVPKNEEGIISKRIYLFDNKDYFSAPLKEKKEVGLVSFFWKGEKLKESPLYIEEQPYKGIYKWALDYIKYYWSSFMTKG